MRRASPMCLVALILAAGTATANQPFSFTESTLTLLPSDAAVPFNSGTAIGVVDMNMDGLDDVVRFDEGRNLQIAYQTTPGAPFTSLAGDSFQTIRVAVAAADHDRNGMRDILCGGYVGGVHLLTANAAGTDFTLSTLADTNVIVQGMNFVDLDVDGDADIFVCDDLDDNHKYRNDGGGTMVLDHALIDTLLPNQAGQVGPNEGNYASIWTDYDNDGDLDMYLSKCRQGQNNPGQLSRINRLFQRQTGSFTDVGAAANLDSGAQSWCADFADIDNDGDLDVFVLNHVMGGADTASALYRNNGNGTFTDVTAGSGVSVTFFGIQALFRDFNNDGFVDLLVSSTGTDYRLFCNDGDGTFTSQPNVFTTAQTGTGAAVPYVHSFAVGDLNDDGWLDIYAGFANLLNNPTLQRDRLYLNDGGANHFLKVRLEGAASNPDGLGARLELYGEWGVQIREVRSGESYGIMNSLTQHFGVGSATTIDRLVVRWPSGMVDTIENPGTDRTLVVSEGGAVLTFEDWRETMFTPAELLDPTISGPHANPDRDALSNIFEWYLDTLPKDPNSTRSEVATIDVEDFGLNVRRITMTVNRRKKPGVVESAEVTSDFVTWLGGIPHVEVLSDTENQLVLRTRLNTLPVWAVRMVLEL